MADAERRFSPVAGEWLARLGLARDAVRQELVARQLAPHLRALGDPAEVEVLDAGCGQGTQAIRLARAGHRVTGIDLEERLLDVARAAAAAEPAEVRGRLRFEHADLLTARFDSPFDAVCCHGVAMYLPSLEETLAALVTAVRAGGTVSVLTRNRAGIAMRAGMAGDWAGALAGFDARTYRNRLGVDDARADEPGEVVAALIALGAAEVAWYGVRLFTDHWGDRPPPDDVEAVMAVEEEAGRREPYRRLAAMTHTVATGITPRAPSG